jgi:hypothetical protein
LRYRLMSFLIFTVIAVAALMVVLQERSKYRVNAKTIAIAFDGHWKSNLPELLSAIRKSQIKDDVKIVTIDVGRNPTALSIQELIKQEPTVLIALNPKVFELFYKNRTSSTKAILVGSNPWVIQDEIDVSKLPVSARIATYELYDTQCLGWLERISLGSQRIALVAWKKSRSDQITKFVNAFESRGYKVTVFTSENHRETAKLITENGKDRFDAWYFPHTPAVWQDAGTVTRAATMIGAISVFEYSHYYSRSGGLLSCAVQHDTFARTAEATKLLLSEDYASGTFEFRPSSLSIGLNVSTAKKLNLTLDDELLRRVDHRFYLTN